MLWFHNFTVPATNGSIRGNGANDGEVRTSGPKAIKSVIISTFKGDSECLLLLLMLLLLLLLLMMKMTMMMKLPVLCCVL
jgi:hypothetical protein